MITEAGLCATHYAMKCRALEGFTSANQYMVLIGDRYGNTVQKSPELATV